MAGNNGASVFVRVDDYKEVRSTVELLKAKLREARATLAKVESLRVKEAEELKQWQSVVDEVENKIRTIDANLLEPQLR